MLSTPIPPSNKDNTSPNIFDSTKTSAILIKEGGFECENHFYPRVLNATIHPLVSSFFSLGNERIIKRYCHLNPSVHEHKLREYLTYKTKHFHWAGSDLMNVTTTKGQRQMIVIETNSCPSGQKSMPLLSDTDEYGGYGIVLSNAFKYCLEKTNFNDGVLAVVFDKNKMEASGYASVLADMFREEKVYLVEFHCNDTDPPVKWVGSKMHIRLIDGSWVAVRACFRYVTQKPWSLFPIHSETLVFNSVVACLSGGRNKLMASLAYELFNAELVGAGFGIRTPETIQNVHKKEIPLWVERMGGHAVIKVPYSNAGQGVYTITSKEELDAFILHPHHYDMFVVQSLVGNVQWSSVQRSGTFYHVGTIPNKKNNTFVTDLRVMVCRTESGFVPVSVYARRARKPLARKLDEDASVSSWDMLGTNLSVKLGESSWTTEESRLLLMDRKDFNQLGLGIDDLIDAYIQTVLSVIAIDKICERLLPNDSFDYSLFQSLCRDDVLLNEIDAINQFN